MREMKVAIIHDWLVTYAGAERVLEQILDLYQNADLYALIDFYPEEDRRRILNKKSSTTFIQKLPLAKQRYRNYLPLMPLAIECFDLRGYDLIISSSHAVAKGVRTHRDQLHICYCHTPIRYAWDLRDVYLKNVGLDRGVRGIAARAVLNYIRKWDERTADRVNFFVANSKYIGDRISRSYGRDAQVIYPPVNVDKFSLSDSRDDVYLAASRMVPYKRMDLIVEAFQSMPDRKLVVIGDGPEFTKVRAFAGKNVTLLGYQPSEGLRDHMQKAKAFIFAAEEDFGIMPVEAQACGTPVIAFGRGGVRETVVPMRNADCGVQSEETRCPTGVFFDEQTVGSLIEAVQLFEANRHVFDPAAIRKNAERFSRERFRKEFKEFVESRLAEHQS